MWETVNLLDQVILETMKEKTLLFRCLMTLLQAWHDNYDQPAMKNVSNRFFEHEITNLMKSSHAEGMIINVINDLRQLVILNLSED